MILFTGKSVKNSDLKVKYGSGRAAKCVALQNYVFGKKSFKIMFAHCSRMSIKKNFCYDLERWREMRKYRR